MKSYKVYRNVSGRIPMLLREHITSFDAANEYATVMGKKTGDTCYVVEYVSRKKTTRLHHLHRI